MLKRLLSDELETFYWMGFILADGWVVSKIDSKNNKINHLGISIQSRDRTHLENFLKWVDISTTRIRTRSRNTIFKNGSTDVSICITDQVSVPLIKEKFGINNDKTNNPPNMSEYKFTEEQTIALIIGFIDGDGSVAMRSHRRPHISFQTSKEWYNNLELINEVVHTFCDESIRNNVCINRRGHASLSLCKCIIAAKLRQFIIDNNLPALERKWEVIDVSDLTK